MKKKWLSILLCLCMALTLLPVSALAADYPDGWPSDASLNEGDTVTMDGVTYTYKGDATDSGISMNTPDSSSFALKEACCWKAGTGYVLYKPTVGSVWWYKVEVTTSAEVTLYNATISAPSDATALELPFNSPSSTKYPVPVTVYVEGTNSLTTDNKYLYSLYTIDDTTFTGGGTLTLTNSAADAWCNLQSPSGAVTIEDGTKITLNGGASYIVGNLTVTGSGSKLTIPSGAKLTMGLPGSGIDPNAPTVTVENGAALENNGALNMAKRDREHPGITGEISGSGVIEFGDSDTSYRLMDGIFIPDGGDVSENGLALATLPTEAMVYSAGSGYILWNPTTATVTLHSANINTTDENALALPYGSDTTIVVEGNNSLQSSNYTIIKTSGNLFIQGSGTLNAQSSTDGYAAVLCSDVLTIAGDVSVSAPTIYSTGRIIVNTTGTITAPKITALETFTHVKGTMTGSLVFENNGDEHNNATQSIYGNVTLTSDKTMGLSSQDASLTVTAGATLTIDSGVILTIEDSMPITNNGTIVNNGTIILPSGTDASAIKALKLTGTGIVKVDSQYYTNDGTRVFLANETLNFTKTAADGNWKTDATVNTDGYQWDGTTNTLTLGGLYLTTTSTDGIDVPAGTTIVLQSGTSSIIRSGSAGSYSIGIDCYDGGSDPLTINGTGTLNVTAGDASGSTNNSLGIYSESGIVIKSGNITAAGGTAKGSSGICSGTGAVTISGGTIQATGGAGTTGSTGIMAATDITISGGAVTAAGGTAANSLGVYAADGTLSITGGTLNAKGNTAAVAAKTAVTLGASRAVTAPSGSSVGESGGYKTVLNGNASATAVAIGAKPSTGGSGSGSSGGNAGSTVTVPVSGNEGGTNVSASVSGGTATIAATDAQLKEISYGTQTGAVKIDVSGTKADTVILPAKVASAVDNASGSEGLGVDLHSGTVILDKPALASVAGKGDVKISVETVDNSKLTDTQKATLGAQAETAFVVDVNVYVNNTRTSTFGDGKITVSVPYTLKPGESPDSITVWFINDDGTIEPKTASYADGKVTFTTEHLSQYLIVNFPFTDVAGSAWCYGSVAYAYDNGLFSGTSATTFSPNATANRQMIWMVLARMDGKAPANMAEAKTWAVENKISDGTNPTGTVTRQQMAAILYRYAQHKGYDTTQGGMAIREFADYDSISAYAQPALAWAVNAGLVQGKNNQVMPWGSATRAQVATILQRFCQNAAK